MRPSVNRSALILLGAACVGLSACASTEVQGPPPLTPTSRFVLQVEPGIDRIALAVHDQGLSGNQQAALSALAGRFAAARADVIHVEAPAGDDPVAARAAWGVRDALASLGVPAERVVVTAYAAPNPRAPVLAGFEVLRAHVPNCAAMQQPVGANFSNQPSAAFGCAVTANLAAQIANPRDIVTPAEMGPADSARRGKVLEVYRAGTITSASQEPLVNGRISQAVE